MSHNFRYQPFNIGFLHAKVKRAGLSILKVFWPFVILKLENFNTNSISSRHMGYFE